MVSISIIIPVYQVEQYVQRCLESVMAQDRAAAEIECIIVDDCGTDGSMGIVRQMVAGYQGPVRFVIVQHEQNRGLSAARNTGLSKASGDYILFVDSDDYLLPDSLSYFLENLSQHPEVDMIVGNVRNAKDDSILLCNITEPCLIDDQNVFFRDMLHHRIYLFAWNKLIRRQVLTENGILFEEGIIYEDQLWSYQLFSCLSSVLLLPRITYLYEYNANSIVNTTFSHEKADLVVHSYTVTYRKMLDCPPDPARYTYKLMPDYLLFMLNFMMNAVDVLSRCEVSGQTARDFHAVRDRLMSRAVKSGRLLVSAFCLLMYSPFSSLQKLRLFRHHYYDIESAVNSISHLTDFLHRK